MNSGRAPRSARARVGPAPNRVAAASERLPVWPGVVTAALVGAVYLAVGSGGTFRFGPSAFPHHILIADAWLHGQLHIRDAVLQQLNEPHYRRYRAGLEGRYRAQGRQLTEEEWRRIRPTLKTPLMHDWSVVDGKYYGYWGPTTAALLLPYVAVAGVEASDRLAGAVWGTLGAFFVYLMLREAGRRHVVPVTPAAAAMLVVLFGLGTVHFYLAVSGQVWFLSQVVAALFLTLAMWTVLRADRAWWWAALSGAAFGLCVLARSSELTTAPFFLFALVATVGGVGATRRRALTRLALAFAIPLAGAGAMQLWYNQARFGSPFEDGVRTQLASGANPRFKRDYDEHGMFSFAYVPRNAYYYFVNPMLRRHPSTGAITFDPFGNSVFLISPALLYVLRSWRRRNTFVVGAWAGVVGCLATLLCFFGTGWYNFGNRYLLDLMPLAILLVAAGMGGRLTRVSMLLIGLSILANAWGTYRFGMEQG